MSKKTMSHLSLLCFVIGVLLWVPNWIFGYGSGIWLMNYVLGPVGIILSIYGRNYLYTFLNLLTTFSFFIFMFLGYL
ncbi:hypothetical protein FO510_15330 [Bacillus pumilus]|nr:hypothetical protein C5Y82_01180 [Bacillus pumilus]MDR4271025.1 hypothetical protein [Bacillus pumilus]OUZ07006.1 hypothetical protein BHE94_14380 [Bacillus pumilus]SNU94049.1 Uncharacterised protein [Bacillus pumilus]